MACATAKGFMYAILNTQVWEDKTCYEGDFKNDQMHGKGKITHPNGDVYDGDWQNDMANGYGVFS